MAIACLTVGKQLGCGIAFLIARWVTSPELRSACCIPHHHRRHTAAPERSSHYSGSSKRSRTIQAMFLALHHHPWQLTFLIRLLPIPISLKNYGMGCLRGDPPFHVFMVCTFVAGLPFSAAWVYLGESCRSLLEALQGKGDGLNRRGAYAQELAFLLVGLVVAVALLVLLGRYTRRYARLIAEREALSAAAATAEAAKTAEDAAAVRALGGRDVSTASSTTTTTTLLTATPPPVARRSLKDDEAEDDEDGEGSTSDGGGMGEKKQRRQRRRRQRRRRRSSESTTSGLSLEISSFLMEEGEGSMETIQL